MTPIRIQRSRKHKQVSPNGLPVVYVGRPSRFGNPFKVVERSLRDKKMYYGLVSNDDTCINIIVENFHFEYSRKIEAMQDAVKGFEIYCKEMDFSELMGCNLSCWCGIDKPCHADTLLKIANQ